MLYHLKISEILKCIIAFPFLLCLRQQKINCFQFGKVLQCFKYSLCYKKTFIFFQSPLNVNIRNDIDVYSKCTLKKNSKCLDMVPNLTHIEIFIKMRWVGPKFNTLWTIFTQGRLLSCMINHFEKFFPHFPYQYFTSPGLCFFEQLQVILGSQTLK